MGTLRSRRRGRIQCENARLNYPKVIERKNGIVNKHAKGIEFLMKKNKVDWIKGYGRLAGPGKVEVQGEGGRQVLDAKNIVLATGSEARMLPGLTPDAQRILTNIEILNLTTVPKTLAVLGAGAVGVEFASCFQRFGTKVSIFEMLPRLVPVEDEDVSKELGRIFKKQGIRVETGARVDNVQRTANGVTFQATLASGQVETVEADALLVAVGRKPNTENIGIQGTRIEVDRGFIKVDPYQRTGEPGVYAIGDIVAGTPQLAHVATAEGMIAIGHIAGVEVKPIRKRSYSRRDLHRSGHRQCRHDGSAGARRAIRSASASSRLLETARQRFSAAMTASSRSSPMKSMARSSASTSSDRRGFELIGEGVLAMEAEATVETLLHTIHAHPTIYEAVGEAFQAVYGMAIMLVPPQPA